MISINTCMYVCIYIYLSFYISSCPYHVLLPASFSEVLQGATCSSNAMRTGRAVLEIAIA